jgi:hypothetical protein
MTIRLVDTGWSREIADAISQDAGELRIVCPFIKTGALDRLLSHRPRAVQVITRFNLADFAKGVSDIAALRKLLAAGARVRGIRNLHAKLYLFGASRALVTSANLTDAALDRNHEFGMVADDDAVIAACLSYFEDMWRRGGSDLSRTRIETWDEIVIRHLATGGKPDREVRLPDFGVEAGLGTPPPVSLPTVVADAGQAFVKFLGEADNREPLSIATIDEIRRAGCHWAVAYPASKRPRAVEDGALIFIARLTRDPSDIRVFGRAIGMKHVPGRDDATPEEIAERPWKATWPRYIRVHHSDFVAGTMANGVSLNQLMDTLGADSFVPTQRNARRGEGNFNPRKAYLQQPAVELSGEGLSWLSERLQLAFDVHGKVPQAALNEFDGADFPAVPSEGSHG